MAVPLNTPRSRNVSSLTRASLVVLGLILLAAGLAKYLSTPGEYRVYSVAAQRMLDGDRVYIPQGDPEAITAPFSYPPFFALAFIPLLPFPWTVQKVLWLLISLGSLIVVLLLVRRAVRPWMERSPWRSVCPEWGFWLLLAVLVGRYVLAGFEMQSHDILVVLLSALCLHASCENRDARAGLFAGLAAACKATPLLFAPAFLFQRRFLATGSLLLTLTAATLLPDLITPAKTGVPWLVTWHNTFLRDIGPGTTAQAHGTWVRWNELNQSLAGVVFRLSDVPDAGATPNSPDIRIWNPSPSVLKAATIGLRLGVLLILGVALWPSRRPLAPDEQRFVGFAQGGVVLCAMLLLSPMSSKPHFAALVLPMSACVADFLYRRRDPVVGASFVVVIFVSSLTVKGIWGTTVGNLFLAYGSVCWTTLLSMLITVRVIRSVVAVRQEAAIAAALPSALPPRPPRFLSRNRASNPHR